jgi:hypothetical protein
MPGTNRIYEEPSRLSQGLVVGLSVAVVAMAGWLVVTIAFPRTAATSTEDDTDATASLPAAAPADRMAASAAPDALRQPAGPAPTPTRFDWPAEFKSSAAAQSAAPPARTALPLAPEFPATLGRAAWPAGPAAPDAGSPARQPAGARAEATDAIMDVLVPQPPRAATTGKDAAAPAPRPAQQRRQKPRVESDAGQ